MPYRKKTLRRMLPQTRELARILDDLESGVKKMKRRLEEVAELEMKARALDRHSCQETLRAMVEKE